MSGKPTPEEVEQIRKDRRDPDLHWSRFESELIVTVKKAPQAVADEIYEALNRMGISKDDIQPLVDTTQAPLTTKPDPHVLDISLVRRVMRTLWTDSQDAVPFAASLLKLCQQELESQQ